MTNLAKIMGAIFSKGCCTYSTQPSRYGSEVENIKKSLVYNLSNRGFHIQDHQDAFKSQIIHFVKLMQDYH